MTDLLDRLTAALADRYAIEHEIGAGGMATVYLAQDARHKRKVAVKVLRPELAAGLGPERFLREIEIAAGLHHPHILPLYDSGEADGFLYYVMPLAEGKSLRDRLSREKQLPLDDALQIAREVADALSYAHGRDVIHRDIKPENIMLESGHAVVTDFGIARAISAAGGERLTATGFFVGTPTYMSPEQAGATEDVDGRSDIYSLGCVLYEMLAGEPPFTGPTALAIIARHIAAPVPTIHTIREAVSVQLDDIIHRALAKVPADRFSAATEFLEVLKLNLTGADTASRLKTSRQTSILVLPFENHSQEADTEYISDGLGDEILTSLSSIKALGVISRTSAMQLKGSAKDIRTIGRDLNVRYVLEGSVRKANSDLRINMKLVDTSTDELVWANKFRGTMEDIFEIEETIARTIVDALKVQLSVSEQERLGERPIPNLQAYEFYLRAKQEILHFTEEALDRALNYLQRGVDILGDNIALQSAMGYVYWQYINAGISGDRSYLEKAQACADRIFALDADSPHGHRLVGLIAIHGGSPQDVATHLKRALEADPNDTDALFWLSLVYGFAGRGSAAVPLVNRLLEIDPLTPFYKMLPGFIALMEGHFQDAIEPFLTAHKLEPANPIVRLTYGQILAINQRLQDAYQVFDALHQDAPDSLFAQLGQIYKHALQGNKEAALAVLNDDLTAAVREDYQYSWSMAECFALMGDAGQSIEWLSGAVNQGFWNYPLLAELDPLLAGVRDEQRFQALMADLKQKWEAFEV